MDDSVCRSRLDTGDGPGGGGGRGAALIVSLRLGLQASGTSGSAS